MVKVRRLYGYSTLAGAVKVRLRYGRSTRKVTPKYVESKARVRSKYNSSTVEYGKSIVPCRNFFWYLISERAKQASSVMFVFN